MESRHVTSWESGHLKYVKSGESGQSGLVAACHPPKRGQRGRGQQGSSGARARVARWVWVCALKPRGWGRKWAGHVRGSHQGVMSGSHVMSMTGREGGRQGEGSLVEGDLEGAAASICHPFCFSAVACLLLPAPRARFVFESESVTLPGWCSNPQSASACRRKSSALKSNHPACLVYMV